jgi:hypothetical protein
MKKIVSILATLLSVSALANRGPQTEPGPVGKISDAEVQVARVLTNQQVKSCVEDFQKSGARISRGEVQRLSPQNTSFTFMGDIVQEGDIVVGSASMYVLESWDSSAPEFPTVKYICRVEIKKN